MAIASGPLLGERPAAATWLGLAVSLTGGAVMVSDDLRSGGASLTGDLYAALGAACAAAYLLSGRALLEGGQEGWLPYVTRVYTVGASVLLALAAGGGEALLGYATRTYALLALLALVPQLGGHTALNRSLARLPAVTVATAVLAEPVGATLLGALVLGEMPSAWEVVGGLLLLAGVYVGLKGGVARREPRKDSPSLPSGRVP